MYQQDIQVKHTPESRLGVPSLLLTEHATRTTTTTTTTTTKENISLKLGQQLLVQPMPDNTVSMLAHVLWVSCETELN